MLKLIRFDFVRLVKSNNTKIILLILVVVSILSPIMNTFYYKNYTQNDAAKYQALHRRAIHAQMALNKS